MKIKHKNTKNNKNKQKTIKLIIFTSGDVVEGDAGAGERVLNRSRDAIGVAVGGDGDGPTVIHLDESRTNVLGDGVGVADLGDLAVLYVPPH